jgi:hypothetical protein
VGTARGMALITRYGAAEHWLAVLVTMRGDGRPSVSVVNAAPLAHPVTSEAVVGFVARGATAELANLRRNPRATLLSRSGWEWIAVHGPVSLIGPNDPLPHLSQARMTQLLRDIYTSAGGRHPDMTAYDGAMAEERRTAVLLSPERFSTNPPGTEHQENS